MAVKHHTTWYKLEKFILKIDQGKYQKMNPPTTPPAQEDTAEAIYERSYSIDTMCSAQNRPIPGPFLTDEKIERLQPLGSAQFRCV